MLTDSINLLISRSHFFINLTLEHLALSFIAIISAIIIGGVIGVVASEYRGSSKWIMGVINFVYTIPSISMLGFLIPLSGIGNTSAVIALIIYGLLPMVRSTYTGMTTIDTNIIEAAKGMGSTKWQILYKIKLPLAIPVIMSGIRNMVIMTLALAGIASFIGAGGLGVAIYRGITTNNMAMTLVGSLLIALLALLSDGLLAVIEKLMTRRKRGRKGLSKGILSGIVVLVLLAIGGFVFSKIKNAHQETGTIRIATKPMTEEYIMGYMLKDLIEQDTSLTVKLTQGVGGGTSNIMPAMEKGDFDLYPEYTGTGWETVLKKQSLYQESLFPKLQKAYQDKYKMQWVGMYGFSDTYAIAVQSDLAKKYHLKTISDLAKVSSRLRFGAAYDFFEREDGYTALTKKYNLTFKSKKEMDINLKYKAAKQDEIDVLPVFTTDGQLPSANLTVLKDDKQLYPSYQAGNVVRTAVLKKYPSLKSVLEKVTGILSEKEMSELNYRVEIKKEKAQDVAKDYLKEKGLLK